MEPLTAAAVGTAVYNAVKEAGKLIWGYAKKTLLNMWDNKYILIIAGFSSGVFVYYYNILYQWFGFPPLLNTAILGIFALINFSWVVSHWKSAPSESSGGSKGPKVSTGS